MYIFNVRKNFFSFPFYIHHIFMNGRFKKEPYVNMQTYIFLIAVHIPFGHSTSFEPSWILKINRISHLIRTFFTRARAWKFLRTPVFPSVEKERARERKSSRAHESVWLAHHGTVRDVTTPPICCQLATLRHPKTRPSLLRFLYYLLNTVFYEQQ